jgi:predicted GNAT family N-acyltransferase
VAIARGRKLKAFALLNNQGHINVLSAARTYGGPLLKKIVNSEPHKQFHLNAVPNAKLLEFYRKHGFVEYGERNNGNLVPMLRFATAPK